MYSILLKRVNALFLDMLLIYIKNMKKLNSVKYCH